MLCSPWKPCFKGLVQQNSKLVQNININIPNFKLIHFIDKLIEYYCFCSKSQL